MIYITESLAPNEKIVREACFHWMYTFNAAMWIVIGIGLAIGLAYAGMWWDINQGVRASFTNIPAELYDQAASEVVAAKGGYLKIFFGLHIGYRLGVIGMFLLGVFMFANMMIVKATTEIAVTTHRVIYKKGLISRQAPDIAVASVEGVMVQQGILGRIFGYGRVAVRGMGVGEVLLPPIQDPLDFRKAIQEAKARLEGNPAEG